LNVEIDKSKPWGFLDGASQNDLCGEGGLLYLSNDHFFEISFGLGEGSNNFAELMSLKMLLIFAAEKGCQNLALFGDSVNVINWVNGIQQCKHIRLANLLILVRELMSSFDTIICRHVYRENNDRADKASKEGLAMAVGLWQIKEIRAGHEPIVSHRSITDLQG